MSEHSRSTPCPDQSWGTVAADVPDPPACIGDCRDQFLRLLLPNNETFDHACRILAHGERRDTHRLLWALYCCDSQLCGVDNLWENHQDPNVNWLINSCQNAGYYSVLDPGPPDEAYVCSHTSDQKQDHTCPRQTVVTSPQANVDDVGDGDVGVLEVEPTAEVPVINEQPTRTTLETTHFKIHASSSSINQDPSSAANIDLSESADRYNQQNDVPTHIKVAIVLATLAGIALVVTFFLCLRRTRRTARNTEEKNTRNDLKCFATPSHLGSPATLGETLEFAAEPGNVSKKTPPPRLQNRRLLSPLPLSPGPKPYPDLTKPLPEIMLPPRHASSQQEDMQKEQQQQQQHRAQAFQAAGGPGERSGATTLAAPKGCKLRTVSSNSYASTSTTSSLSPSWTLAMPHWGGAGTGAWPPGRHRPQGSIPGSPGPPPDRALPTTPPKSPTAAVQRAGGIGVAVGHHPTSMSNNSYHGVGLSQETHELRDLSEAYLAQEHGYKSTCWNGASGPGAALLLSRKKPSDYGSPLLEENSVDELGVRY